MPGTFLCPARQPPLSLGPAGNATSDKIDLQCDKVMPQAPAPDLQLVSVHAGLGVWRMYCYAADIHLGQAHRFGGLKAGWPSLFVLGAPK